MGAAGQKCTKEKTKHLVSLKLGSLRREVHPLGLATGEEFDAFVQHPGRLCDGRWKQIIWERPETFDTECYWILNFRDHDWLTPQDSKCVKLGYFRLREILLRCQEGVELTRDRS